ncbi:hypothetical protein COHA_002509 [Chlorella ohadii]|uniref:Uncharacterized protein n=1 Tax=Chlorella ohadii TaxID=2649997 RepID=A0AAD5DVK0_9CHLO|nr:hypothetical protein COHA_002509 [Chlorella ohadii]
MGGLKCVCSARLTHRPLINPTANPCHTKCSTGDVVLTGTYGSVDVTTSGISTVYVSGESCAVLLVWGEAPMVNGISNSTPLASLGHTASHFYALSFAGVTGSVSANLGGISNLYLQPTSSNVQITGR